MRRTVLAIALLLLICLVLFLMLLPEDPVSSEPPSPPLASEPETTTPPPGPLASDAPNPGHSDPGHSGHGSPAGFGSTPPVPAEERVTVTGIITVVEEDGRTGADLDGVVEFSASKGAREIGLVAEVRKGAWRAEVPIGSSIEITRIKLDGRLARPDPSMPERYQVERDTALDIRARWLRKTLLRVIAEDTGRELKNVHLLRIGFSHESVRRHPGEQAVEMTGSLHGDSPIEIPEPDFYRLGNVHMYFASSPGYAWGRISIDLMAGGERVLRLAPGGDLGVQLRATDLDASAVLRVRLGEDRKPHFECSPNGRTEIDIKSLPGGLCRIAVEIGPWFKDPVVLAAAEAVVVPGRRTVVELIPAELPVPDRVPFSGEIFVPPEWGREQLRLSLKLLDPPRGGMEKNLSLKGSQVTPVPDREGVFRFDAGMVQPGRYLLTVVEPLWFTSLRIGEAGTTDHRIEVPPPGRIVVRIIDEATDREADILRISWNPARPKWVEGGTTASARRDPVTRCFEFLVPQGRIEVRGSHPEYTHVSKTVDVGRELKEIEFRVRKACGIILLPRDGDTSVAWNGRWKLTVVAIGGSGREIGGSRSSESYRVKLSEPGAYRLSFAGIDGFEPIPPQDVRVEPGSYTTVVLPLVRDD